MNNIYVDELPKCCLLCVQNCGTRQKDISCFNMDCEGCIGGRPKDCHLKKLSNRLAEERKKVVQEIREKLCRIEDTLINLGNGKEDALSYFVKILDQIERGE